MKGILRFACGLWPVLVPAVVLAYTTSPQIAVSRSVVPASVAPGGRLSVTLTVDVGSIGSQPLRGFYVADYVPDDLSPTAGTVTLDGSPIGVLRESDPAPRAYPGTTTERWVLETPPGWTQNRPVPAGATLVIAYDLTIPSGTTATEISLPGCVWVGVLPGTGDAGLHFGFEDGATQIPIDSLPAPAAPSGLAASAQSSSEIAVSWQDNSGNEDQFKLDRRESGTTVWTRVFTSGPNASTHTDTGLAAETKYYYQVKAWNSTGNSAYSNIDDATTPADQPPVAQFTAYNDLLWVSAEPTANITTYSKDQSGVLVDYASGGPTPVSLSVSGGTLDPAHGAAPDAGTDGYDTFIGKVGLTGLISYAATDLTLSFSGLAPTSHYELVLFGNRDNPAYTDRLSTVTLSGADAFENVSSAGTDFAGPADPATVVCNGWNSEDGYVARFTGIAPGTDGAILVTLSDATSKFYASAVMLKRVETDAATVSIAKGAQWRYHKGLTEASSPASEWRRLGFDDSGWATGNAPFGYGPLSYGTSLDMADSYASVFLRRVFLVQQPQTVNQLSLSVDYDDGFIIWLNGEEIARVNVDGAPGSFVAHDTPCSGYVSGSSASWSNTFEAGAMPVLATTNVLAIQLFNAALASGDAMMDLELACTTRKLSIAEDADQDDVPDGWEVAEYGGAGVWGPNDDPDHDGLSNLDEYIAGTDPEDETGYLKVETRLQSGQLEVVFVALAANGAGYEGLSRYYALEQRQELGADAVWTLVPGYQRILGNDTVMTYLPGGDEPVFHRLRVWLE